MSRSDRLKKLSRRLTERQFLLRDTKRFLRRHEIKIGPAVFLSPWYPLRALPPNREEGE